MTYLALLVGAIRCVLQSALQRALAVSPSQKLADLACKRLDVGGGHGGYGGGEGGEVEVGGGVGVESIDVDGPPIEGGHGGVSRGGTQQGGGEGGWLQTVCRRCAARVVVRGSR